MARRRKLFSSDGFVTYENDEREMLRTVICADCGYRIETAESPSKIYCPRCGGKRFNISLFPEDREPRERKKFITDFDTEFEKDLKEHSGKKMSKDDFEKKFSDHSSYLIDKGFAQVNGNTVTISPNAYNIEKLFSKITISVTKTLELEPSCVSGLCSKETMLDRLKEDCCVPEKKILILRKAHGMPSSRMFSENGESAEDWVKDSNIIPDLETEYHNKQFGIEQFLRILRGRYPDAPEGILDILVDRGTIFLSGGTVTVHKTI